MIRPYLDSDLESLQDVWYRASKVGHPFLDEPFLALERGRIEDVYMPMSETWVYLESQTVAGFISLMDNEVGALFVDPDCQGKGIGRALMDHAHSLRATLELDVFKANKIGRRFYDRYGFELIEERVHEETGYPMLRMKLAGD